MKWRFFELQRIIDELFDYEWLALSRLDLPRDEASV